MILALAQWVLWRAPVDDISLNLHKVMKAGNGRTKQFTCWHGKKWFANMGGERKSRQRARAKGWKRSRDRDEGEKKGERGGRRGRIKDRQARGEKQKNETDRLQPQLVKCWWWLQWGDSKLPVRLSPSPHKHKNTCNRGEIDLKSGGSVLTRPLFYSSFPAPIVITYQRATCAAGTGGFNNTLEPQQVFLPKDQIYDCSSALNFADQFDEDEFNFSI